MTKKPKHKGVAVVISIGSKPKEKEDLPSPVPMAKAWEFLKFDGQVLPCPKCGEDTPYYDEGGEGEKGDAAVICGECGYEGPVGVPFPSQFMKALPEHQMFRPPYQRRNLAEKTYDGDGIDVGERQEGEGTIHPAACAMMQRRLEEYRTPRSKEMDGELPNLNLDAAWRVKQQGNPNWRAPPPMIDRHPEYYADSMPYGSIDDPTDQWNAHQNPDNKRRTKAPQTYSYQKDYPTDEEVGNFKQDYPPAFQDALKNTNIGRRAAEME